MTTHYTRYHPTFDMSHCQRPWNFQSIGDLSSVLSVSNEYLLLAQAVRTNNFRCSVQVVKIADAALVNLKHIGEENAQWAGDSDRFQECPVRGDGSTAFHPRKEGQEINICKGIKVFPFLYTKLPMRCAYTVKFNT